MNKAPTAKSRLIALVGTLCAIPVYIVYGWFNISISTNLILLFALIPLGLLHFSNSIRQRDGQELRMPDQLLGRIKNLMRLELTAKIINVLLILVSFGAIAIGKDKDTQRVIFCGSTIVILASPIVDFLIGRNYRNMLSEFDRAADDKSHAPVSP